MRLSPHPDCASDATSIRTLESNLSPIYNLFAPRLMCPGSSLTFANETHLISVLSPPHAAFPPAAAGGFLWK